MTRYSACERSGSDIMKSEGGKNAYWVIMPTFQCSGLRPINTRALAAAVPPHHRTTMVPPEMRQYAMAHVMGSLHPFFPNARPPPTPLTEEDTSLFMLLVTYSDALDALPLEFTRSFSDLRELDAVLGAHLASLSLRVQHLAAIIEDTNVSPEERFMALRGAAEEARAYKMGGEDKVRVAINTSEMVRSFH